MSTEELDESVQLIIKLDHQTPLKLGGVQPDDP